MSDMTRPGRRHDQSLAGAVFALLVLVLLVGFVAVGTGRAATEKPAASAAPAVAAVPSPSPVAVASVPHRHVTALPRKPKAVAQPADPWARFGFDISWPQCEPGGAVLPPALGIMAFVGLSGGRPMTTNRCVAEEWRWAQSRKLRAGYVNLAAPPAGQDPVAYGAATVRFALDAARASGMRMSGLWLDVEVGNAWSKDPAVNVAVVRGAATAATAAGVQPGVYSSRMDWTILTGNASLSMPEWRAVPDGRVLGASCAEPGFGGRQPDLVQAVFSTSGHNIDGDLRCTNDPALQRLLGG
jgi:hypothetical protein